MTIPLQTAFQLGSISMFPWLDSYTQDELSNQKDTLFWVGLGATVISSLVTLAVVVFWSLYHRELENRIANFDTKEKGDGKAQTAALKKRIEGLPITRGLLYPGNEELPDPVALASNYGVEFKDPLVIYLGSNPYVADTFPLAVLKQGSKDIIKLERKDGGISLSAEFYNKDSDYICGIKNNEFEPGPGNDFMLDLTPRERPTRLVVRNRKNVKIIEVNYRNTRTVQIMGVFYAQHERLIIMRSDFVHLGAEGLPDPTFRYSNNLTLLANAAPGVLHVVPDFKPIPSGLANQDRCIAMRPLVVNEFAAGQSVKGEFGITNISTGPIRVVGYDSVQVIGQVAESVNQKMSEFQRREQPAIAPCDMRPGETYKFRFEFHPMNDAAILGVSEGHRKCYIAGSFSYFDTMERRNTA